MLPILRGNHVTLTLTLMLNTLRSILRSSATFYKHCNPLVYQILARMLSFFEKLKPANKDIIVSDCSFDRKMQSLIFWVPASFCPKARRPESKRPNSKHSGGSGCGMFGVWDVGCGTFARTWDVDLQNAASKQVEKCCN